MSLRYLSIIFRYLSRNRTLTIVNVFGLTLGFACFILIGLYIYDELNFDMFHRDAARMARVIQHETMEDGQTRKVGQVAARIAPEMVSQFPEVESAMRIAEYGRLTMGTEDPANRDYEPIIVADTNFFQFFDFDLVEGDPETALVSPNAVVLSENLARKYFGREPAMGKTLLANQLQVVVTGIMKNSPANSHIKLDLIFSEATMRNYFTQYDQYETTDWTTNNFLTYVKLKPGADIRSLETRVTHLVKQNYPSDQVFRSTYSLQPLRSIHMHSEDIQGAVGATIKPFYLYMFGAVGFLILLIACLNYMNLTTATAFKRTREMGTRKTLGASKLQLVSQFMVEALVLSIVSFGLATIVLSALLPEVNGFLEKNLSLSIIPWPWILATVLFMVFMGILSAVYPAFIVSRVAPAEAIKSDVKISDRSVPLRKILVIGQFAIAIVMISSTTIIYRQLEFMRTKELGFDLQNLLVIDINSRAFRERFEALKQEFLNLPQVEGVAVSSRVPGEWKNFPIAKVRHAATPVERDMIYVAIDDDFLKTYEIELRQGRNFTSQPGDSAKVLLTQAAVDQWQLDDPVGTMVEIPSVRFGGTIEELEQPFRAEVIGVVDNFHFESFRQELMPLIFAFWNNPIQSIDYYTLRLNTSDWDETLSRIKSTGYEFDTENPIEHNFLESRFEDFYKADQRRGQIFLVFSFTIVIIACVGLFALVSFSIQRRKKEIGVRKVMGASVRNILGLISREFLGLVAMACLVSVPLTWVLMKDWLQDFAYHVPLNVGTFLFSGIVAVLIATVTIFFRTIRAATANPVDSLRND